MKSVLIVDDARPTREGLRKHIHWEELGIDKVYDAENLSEILKRIEVLKPDIILSDICMPEMNGIEFCKLIRQKLPDCQIIFMSGYSDKEYLMGAIELEAVSYIEKPFSLKDMEEAIQKAVQKHNKAKFREEYKQNIAKTLTENNLFIRERLLHQLITPKQNKENIIKELNKYQIFPDKEVYFKVVIFKVKDSDKVEFEELTDQIQLWFQEVHQLCSVKDREFIIVIYSDNEPEKLGSNSKIMKRVCPEVENGKSEGFELYCAVGEPVKGAENIFKSYQSAIFGLQQLFFHGYQHVELPSKSLEEYIEFDEELYINFEKSLMEYNQIKTNMIANEIYLKIKSIKTNMVLHIRSIYFRFLYLLFQEAAKLKRKMLWQENEMIGYIWDRIYSFETLSECQAYFLAEINEYYINTEELAFTNKTILDIKSCIQNSYSNPDLSLNTIADQVYLTPTYLANLFKKKTGKTIGQYITWVRIEQAKILLKDRKLKLYDIALRLGYSDANYFTKIFKKTIGVTPSEYREKYNT